MGRGWTRGRCSMELMSPKSMGGGQPSAVDTQGGDGCPQGSHSLHGVPQVTWRGWMSSKLLPLTSMCVSWPQTHCSRASEGSPEGRGGCQEGGLSPLNQGPNAAEPQRGDGAAFSRMEVLGASSPRLGTPSAAASPSTPRCGEAGGDTGDTDPTFPPAPAGCGRGSVWWPTCYVSPAAWPRPWTPPPAASTLS